MVATDRLVDRYELLEEIARGGMGTVYRAIDHRLGRSVAIKMLRSELARDVAFVERFRREARAAASLSHPNIAGVFDYGEDDGRHFIVMEFVDGEDLDALLRREGRLEPERAIEIAVQICNSLQHAHSAGVIHRDVKPGNIIVSDRVKVTDFGIARAAGDSALTATGSVMGTAAYISPEQAQGVRVGPASDIYSLGIVLYEMLTSAVPFTGDSLVAVAMRHIEEDVPVPSELNPAVPSALDSIVKTACAKRPDDRYPSATAFAMALGDASEQGDTAPLISPGAEQTIWPIPGNRWDPARLGRIVMFVLGALALIAATLLLARVAGNDEAAVPKRARGGVSPAPSEPLGVQVPDVVQLDAEAAETLLEAQGFEVELITVDPFSLGDVFVEEDLVIATSPAPNDLVEPGETIVVYVSSGEGEEDDHPGKGNGKGKDKGKGHGDED